MMQRRETGGSRQGEEPYIVASLRHEVKSLDWNEGKE